jgi:undecaprenyl diphosphate synthase
VNSAPDIAETKGEVEAGTAVGSRYEKVPKHVAFIMDGNGRWAQEQGNLERIMGHEKGAGNIRKLVEAAEEIGIEYVTFFTFSTENWARPNAEVEFILSDLLVRYLEIELPFMKEKNVRFNAIGDISALPQHTRDMITRVKAETAGNTGVKTTLALNYGGRQEILEGIKKLARDAKEDPSVVEDLNLENFREYLYDPTMPDPDILVRTGGEMRVSNFFLWQLSYTEIWITDTFWPDFGPEHLFQAVEDFNSRQRRYGGL